MIFVTVRDQQRAELSARSRRYVKSLITMSTPNISSSGNISPQSTTTRSSAVSMTVMLRPISPQPPSGTMRRYGSEGGSGTTKVAAAGDLPFARAGAMGTSEEKVMELVVFALGAALTCALGEHGAQRQRPSALATPAPAPARERALAADEIFSLRARRRAGAYLRMRVLELRKAGLDRAADVIERRLPVDELLRAP